MIDATNQLTDYTAGGPIAPIDWTRQHEPRPRTTRSPTRPAQECAGYVKVTDGEFELVGEADAPWFCWPGDDLTWADPEPTNFE